MGRFGLRLGQSVIRNSIGRLVFLSTDKGIVEDCVLGAIKRQLTPTLLTFVHDVGSESLASLVLKESGRRDLNSRPLEPHSSALPSCATARKLRGKMFNWMRENEKENFSDPPYFSS